MDVIKECKHAVNSFRVQGKDEGYRGNTDKDKGKDMDMDKARQRYGPRFLLVNTTCFYSP